MHPLLLAAFLAFAQPVVSDLARALSLMDTYPLVDGHVDLPFIVRSLGKSPLATLRSHGPSMPGHIDLQRMRAGRLGGLFMVAWTECPPSHAGAPAGYLDTGEVPIP
jgi:membrane dipeptidase